MILLEVYSAGEDKIIGADSKTLAGSIRQRGKVDPIYAESPDDVAALLKPLLMANDVVLTQGAGNVGALAATLAEQKLVGGVDE